MGGASELIEYESQYLFWALLAAVGAAILPPFVAWLWGGGGTAPAGDPVGQWPAQFAVLGLAGAAYLLDLFAESTSRRAVLYGLSGVVVLFTPWIAIVTAAVGGPLGLVTLVFFGTLAGGFLMAAAGVSAAST